MKKILSAFSILLAGLSNLPAQNPYAAFGIEEQVLHYDDTHKEVFTNDTIKPIGYALYSIKDGLLNVYDLHDSLIAAHKIDPSKVARWLSVDRLAGEYSDLSPYAYVANSPIIAVDPDGQRILFVNGHYQDNWFGRRFLGADKGGREYWGAGFASAAQNFFNDHTAIANSNFIDGSSTFGGDMNGKDRYDAGYAYAKANLAVMTADMVEGETFKIVTHSEGGAYGSGVAQYLLDQGYKVETVVHLSADEGDEFSTPQAPTTYQLGYAGDWVTGNKKIHGVDKSGLVNSGLGWDYVHGSTKGADVFDEVLDLTTVRTQDNIGMVDGKAAAWKTQVPGTTSNNTDFTEINGIGIMQEDGKPKKQ